MAHFLVSAHPHPQGTAPCPLIFLAYHPPTLLFSPKMSQRACCTTWLKLATHFSFWKPSSTPATPQTLTFNLVLLLFNYPVNCLMTCYLGLQLMVVLGSRNSNLQLIALGLAYIRYLIIFESLSGEFAITSLSQGQRNEYPAPPFPDQLRDEYRFPFPPGMSTTAWGRASCDFTAHCG